MRLTKLILGNIASGVPGEYETILQLKILSLLWTFFKYCSNNNHNTVVNLNYVLLFMFLFSLSCGKCSVRATVDATVFTGLNFFPRPHLAQVKTCH